MRVFILGAGFSHEAGYPLASGLLDDIAQMQSQSDILGEQGKWEFFEQWCKKQMKKGGDVREIFRSGNPEHLLTYLDIAAISHGFRHDQLRAEAARSLLDERIDASQRLKDLTRHARIGEAAFVGFALEDSIRSYFAKRHLQDHRSGACCSDPIGRFFKRCMEHGDVILTFNYDTLAERGLLHAGMWWPHEGYGFGVPLSSENGVDSMVGHRSDVGVLKLHGSVGWCAKDDEVVLDCCLLQGLGISATDARATPPGNMRAGGPMLLPSYVKVLGHPVMVHLWVEAARALRTADEVTIIGYSLPLADQAATTLFATSLSDNDCPVVVVNPAHQDDIAIRFEQVIARQVVHRRMKFGEWVDTGCLGS